MLARLHVALSLVANCANKVTDPDLAVVPKCRALAYRVGGVSGDCALYIKVESCIVHNRLARCVQP